jgi:hypothetical protein
MKTIQQILDEDRSNSKINEVSESYINRSLAMKARDEEYFSNYIWILRSPGNDLLKFYDLQNELLGKDNRAYSAIPPSVVYYYRFEHEYPKELFDKSKNYGRLSYLRDRLSHYFKATDNTYWGQVYNKRYDWLIDNLHKEWKFQFRSELIQHLKENFDQTSFKVDLAINESTNKLKKFKFEQMFWRGKMRGWSIVAIPK